MRASVLAMAMAALLAPGAAQADETAFVGTWRGESLCVQKGTACHDEVAVYRISAVPGKRGVLTVSGGRVVDGDEVVMGTGEWRYDGDAHALVSQGLPGVITLTIDGDKMTGTYVLADKTVLRRIALRRSPDKR